MNRLLRSRSRWSWHRSCPSSRSWRRRLFGAVLVDLQRRGHEVVPDQRREGAPEHGVAVEVRAHRDQLVRIADPHGDRVLGVPAHEPGVAVVGGGAGLAGGELADRGGACRCRTAAPFRASRSRSARRRGAARAGSAPGCGPGATRRAAAAPAGFDFLDSHRRAVFGQRSAHAPSAVGDRLVGVGHVDRRDADRQPADRHRRIGRQRGRDAHAVGDAGDAAGGHLQAHFGVDRVVRVGRGPGEGVRAGVVAFVVVDDELFLPTGVGDDEHLLPGSPHRFGRDAVLERGGQVERLERGARLALALGGQVERARRRSCARRPSRAPRRSSFRSPRPTRWDLRDRPGRR